MAQQSSHCSSFKEMCSLWVVFALSLLALTSASTYPKPIEQEHQHIAHAHRPKLADGCLHVYIDMGTNIGHQIRKVYEPELYPGNPTEEIYNKYFGPAEKRKSSVCSFGFEANDVHEARLERLEQAYNAWGARVTVFTSTAVYVEYGNTTFRRSPEAAVNNQWDAHIGADGPEGTTFTVDTVDIADFMRREILGRQIPEGHTAEPAIVMKSDIEGADEQVMARMMLRGVYCHIDHIYAEDRHFHTEFAQAIKLLSHAEGHCRTQFQFLDDEGGDDCLPLPGHSQADPDVIMVSRNCTQEKLDREAKAAVAAACEEAIEAGKNISSTEGCKQELPPSDSWYFHQPQDGDPLPYQQPQTGAQLGDSKEHLADKRERAKMLLHALNTNVKDKNNLKKRIVDKFAEMERFSARKGMLVQREKGQK